MDPTTEGWLSPGRPVRQCVEPAYSVFTCLLPLLPPSGRRSRALSLRSVRGVSEAAARCRAHRGPMSLRLRVTALLNPPAAHVCEHPRGRVVHVLVAPVRTECMREIRCRSSNGRAALLRVIPLTQPARVWGLGSTVNECNRQGAELRYACCAGGSLRGRVIEVRPCV